MLFTGKGDGGTTKTYGAKERISKSSSVAEALGSIDELNSFLGLAKVKSGEKGFELLGKRFEAIVHAVQQNLFIIQAELAGYPMKLEEGKVKEAEDYINAAEKEMPPIKTFFISGGTELAATFDVARTLARRAERRVVGYHEALLAQSTAEGATEQKGLGKDTLAYLNRLSSLLYALARLSNHKSGITEEPPAYK